MIWLVWEKKLGEYMIKFIAIIFISFWSFDLALGQNVKEFDNEFYKNHQYLNNCNSDSIENKDDKKITLKNNYHSTNLVPNTDNSNVIYSIISIFANIISIFFLWYNVKKQINSTEKNIIKQYLITENNTIRETLISLINEINNSDGLKIKSCKYVSNMHFELENKLILFLDNDNFAEKDLIECVTKFKTNRIENISQWIDEIRNKSSIIINKRKEHG